MTQQAEHTDRPIRVGVADKRPLIQAALTHLLKTDPRFELVDVWPDGERLLQAIDDCRIDVLVSGWVLQPGEGKYILDRLRARPTAPRVVIYTGASSDAIPAKKPAPDIYLDALRQLGLSAADCVAIEDSRNGLLSAHQAGIPTLVTPGIYTDDQDFSEAQLVLPDLSSVDVTELLAGEFAHESG